MRSPNYEFGLVDQPVDAQTLNFDDSTTDDKGLDQFDMTPDRAAGYPAAAEGHLHTPRSMSSAAGR